MEPAGRRAARRARTRRKLIATIGLERPGPSRLRIRSLQRRADRDPVRGRVEPDPTRAGELPVRERVGQGPVPDSARRADRGRPASTGDRHVIVVDREHVHGLRAVRRVPARRRPALARRLGRDLQPALKPSAPRRVDVGRRRGTADPARPRPLRRGRARRDRPRAALHRAVHGGGVRLPGPPRGVDVQRPEPPADGAAGAAEGGGRTSRGFPARPASSPQALKTLRDDPRRQRVAVVHLRARPTGTGTTTRCTCSIGSPVATSRS